MQSEARRMSYTERGGGEEKHPQNNLVHDSLIHQALSCVESMFALHCIQSVQLEERLEECGELLYLYYHLTSRSKVLPITHKRFSRYWQA